MRPNGGASLPSAVNGSIGTGELTEQMVCTRDGVHFALLAQVVSEMISETNRRLLRMVPVIAFIFMTRCSSVASP